MRWSSEQLRDRRAVSRKTLHAAGPARPSGRFTMPAVGTAGDRFDRRAPETRVASFGTARQIPLGVGGIHIGPPGPLRSAPERRLSSDFSGLTGSAWSGCQSACKFCTPIDSVELIKPMAARLGACMLSSTRCAFGARMERHSIVTGLSSRRPSSVQSARQINSCKKAAVAAIDRRIVRRSIFPHASKNEECLSGVERT